MLSQTKKVFFVIGALLLSTVATASTVKSVTVPANTAPKQPILIQGPMPIEAEYFADLLERCSH